MTVTIIGVSRSISMSGIMMRRDITSSVNIVSINYKVVKKNNCISFSHLLREIYIGMNVKNVSTKQENMRQTCNNSLTKLIIGWNVLEKNLKM